MSNSIRLALGESVVIYGVPRTGKTALAQLLIQRRAWPRVCVMVLSDEPTHPWWDYTPYGRCFCDDIPNLNRFYTTDLRRTLSMIEKGVVCVVYEPEAGKTLDDLRKEWDHLCGAACKARNYAVVCDETALVCSRTPGDIMPWHQYALRQGPKFGVTLVQASQRPVDMNALATTLSPHRFLFHVDGFDVKRHITPTMGEQAGETARCLKKHEFAYFFCNTQVGIFPPIPFKDAHPERSRNRYEREGVLS